jgi:hypothetical protein
MHRLMITALFLSFAAGCATRAPERPAVAAPAPAADVSRDPSWTPPDESGVVIVGDETATPKGDVDKSAKDPAQNLPVPNPHKARRGTVHPATE